MRNMGPEVESGGISTPVAALGLRGPAGEGNFTHQWRAVVLGGRGPAQVGSHWLLHSGVTMLQEGCFQSRTAGEVEKCPEHGAGFFCKRIKEVRRGEKESQERNTGL